MLNRASVEATRSSTVRSALNSWLDWSEAEAADRRAPTMSSADAARLAPRISRLEQSDRIHRASGPAWHLQRQRHEHELVALLFGARLRERFEQRVVEKGHAVAVKHA